MRRTSLSRAVNAIHADEQPRLSARKDNDTNIENSECPQERINNNPRKDRTRAPRNDSTYTNKFERTQQQAGPEAAASNQRQQMTVGKQPSIFHKAIIRTDQSAPKA